MAIKKTIKKTIKKKKVLSKKQKVLVQRQKQYQKELKLKNKIKRESQRRIKTLALSLKESYLNQKKDKTSRKIISKLDSHGFTTFIFASLHYYS